MEFRDALQKSLKSDIYAHTDPFFLYSQVSDLVGNDYEAKKAAKEFYRIDAKYGISKAIIASAPKVKRKKRRKLVYRIKRLPDPPDMAYVFYTDKSSVFHISGECPCLNNKGVYRTTYEYARYSDYLRLREDAPNHRLSHRRVRAYKPKICHRCGNFNPTFARGILDKIRLFLYYTFGIGEPVRFIRFNAQNTKHSYKKW